MPRALRAWAINRGAKNSVRNLRYGFRTRLVRGISKTLILEEQIIIAKTVFNLNESTVLVLIAMLFGSIEQMPTIFSI